MSPGERIFRDQGCSGCHASGFEGANLSVARVRAVVSNGTEGMPQFKLSAPDLKALAEFVATRSRAR